MVVQLNPNIASKIPKKPSNNESKVVALAPWKNEDVGLLFTFYFATY